MCSVCWSCVLAGGRKGGQSYAARALLEAEFKDTLFGTAGVAVGVGVGVHGKLGGG
jgi:hypothetical protein